MIWRVIWMELRKRMVFSIHCQELTWAPDVDTKLQLEKILREWLALLVPLALFI